MKSMTPTGHVRRHLASCAQVWGHLTGAWGVCRTEVCASALNCGSTPDP